MQEMRRFMTLSFAKWGDDSSRVFRPVERVDHFDLLFTTRFLQRGSLLQNCAI